MGLLSIKLQPVVALFREWLLPDARSVISVSQGATMVLSCPGKAATSNRKGAANQPATPEVSLQCTAPGILLNEEARSQVVEVSQLGCASNPTDVEQLVVGGRCGPANQSAQLVDIGFHVGQGHFRSVLSLCHEAETEHTLFARHTLRGSSAWQRNREPGRPAFREGEIFYRQVRAAQAYTQQSQRELFSRLFGAQQATEYLSNSFYLAKGHLAPDADFLFKGK